MKELFQTEYGAKWFRKEGATLDAEGRRKLYSRIHDWEHVAISGVQSYAHAMGAAARAARYPFGRHMKQMLIEVSGLEYIQKVELEYLRKKQEEEREMLKRRQENNEYLAKLDSEIDDFFN